MMLRTSLNGRLIVTVLTHESTISKWLTNLNGRYAQFDHIKKCIAAFKIAKLLINVIDLLC